MKLVNEERNRKYYINSVVICSFLVLMATTVYVNLVYSGLSPLYALVRQKKEEISFFPSNKNF